MSIIIVLEMVFIKSFLMNFNKKCLKRYAFFLILLFSFFPCFALNNSVILQRIKATNENAIKTIKEIEIRQETKVEFKDIVINSEVVNYKKQNKFRLEIASKTKFTSKKRATLIYDGNQLWKIESGIKAKISNSNNNIYLKLISKSQWLDNIETSAQISGVEIIGSQPCYHILLTDNISANLKSVWVDTLEMLLCKAAFCDTNTNYTILYQKYTAIHNGYKIPYQIKVYIGDKCIAETTVKMVKVNGGIKDDLFDAQKERSINFRRLFSEMF